MTKKELAFRRRLRTMALYEANEWVVYYKYDYHGSTKINYNKKFPSLDGLCVGYLYKLVKNATIIPKEPNKISYRKVWGLFRKEHLHEFDYVLTDSWEDIEYRFTYDHLEQCAFALRTGLWMGFKGSCNVILYKPKYVPRSFEELKEIREKGRIDIIEKKENDNNEQKENKE